MVDVFPPGSALPVRIELFGDEVESLAASTRPTSGRRPGSRPSTCCPRPSSWCRPAAPRRSGSAWAGPRPACRSASPPTSSDSKSERSGAADGGRAVRVGDAAEIWAGIVCPATGFDHIEPETLVVLDEPGDLAEAAQFLWRQADERRAELIAAGELPRDWPLTYLPPRDWKGRLVRSRTVELTWESEGSDAAGTSMAARGLSSGDLFGWREPVLPAARTGRLADALEAFSTDGARIVLASDQAPRLAELLAEAGNGGRGDRPAGRGAAARCDRPDRAEPERWLQRRSRRPRRDHRPGAVRIGPRAPAEGPAPGRPARHHRTADPGRPGRPHRPRHRPLRADAASRWQRRGARLPRAELRRRRSDLRPG